MSREGQGPILVHAHIPKTAGESFIDLLVRNFGMRAYRFEHGDPNFVLTPEELERLFVDRPDLIAFSSHHIRVFPTVLAGRTALYFTILRDPTERFVSLLKYVRRNFFEFSFEAQRFWPDDTPDCSLRKLAEYALLQIGPDSQSCLQTRFFCHPAYCEVPLGYDMCAYGVNSYILASGCLDHFFLVGIMEEMERTLEVLAAKLAKVGISLPIASIDKINATKVLDKELDWLNSDDRVGRQVLLANINDSRIYERYRAHLNAEYENLKKGRVLLNGFFDRESSSDSKSLGSESRDLGKPGQTEIEQAQKAIREFTTWDYERINQRRLEHLSSLQLDFNGKSVWEVSAGVGDLSSFFIDRNAHLTITDVRPVLLAILRDRYPMMQIEELDLEIPRTTFDRKFDVIACYGSLYHVRNPDQAIAFMAARCSGILIIESCVSFGGSVALNLVEEDRTAFSQAYHGIGCRPTRGYIFEELSKHFSYVYVTAEQPRHEQFPIDWDTSSPDGTLARTVFVAARKALDYPKLLSELPRKQSRIR
jgi:2-polyprenyl-3-methyl-5-hydroxy-6-metoxy-1,4-benzoquinol methylase